MQMGEQLDIIINEVDRAPMIKIGEREYAHVFPVTIFQAERAIWSKKVTWQYTQESRPQWQEASQNNFKKFFVRNLTIAQMREYKQWISGDWITPAEIVTLREKLRTLKLVRLHNQLDSGGHDLRFCFLMNRLTGGNVSNVLDLHRFIGDELLYSGSLAQIPIYNEHAEPKEQMGTGPEIWEARILSCVFRFKIIKD